MRFWYGLWTEGVTAPLYAAPPDLSGFLPPERVSLDPGELVLVGGSLRGCAGGCGVLAVVECWRAAGCRDGVLPEVSSGAARFFFSPQELLFETVRRLMPLGGTGMHVRRASWAQGLASLLTRGFCHPSRCQGECECAGCERSEELEVLLSGCCVAPAAELCRSCGELFSRRSAAQVELVAALGPLAAELSGGLPERWHERFPSLTRLRFESDRRGCSRWLAAVVSADTAARDLAASDDECRALARMLPVSAPGSAAAMVVAKLGRVRAAFA